MFTHTTQIRVRYSETDKMGFLYYGNYAQYFEVGRVEALRSLGVSYADLEDKHGIIMPVRSMKSKFIKPALYDELLSIETSIKQIPDKTITFNVKVFGANGD
ncbi:MAG: thioesterase family protein [Bacteroidota bacterium]